MESGRGREGRVRDGEGERIKEGVIEGRQGVCLGSCFGGWRPWFLTVVSSLGHSVKLNST